MAAEAATLYAHAYLIRYVCMPDTPRMQVAAEAAKAPKPVAAPEGAHFTCFTSTKVQVEGSAVNEVVRRTA